MTDPETQEPNEHERTLLELLRTAEEGTAETQGGEDSPARQRAARSASPEDERERQNRELLGLLGYAPEPVAPAAEVKAKIFAAIRPAASREVSTRDAPVTPVAPMPPAQPPLEHPRFARRRRGEPDPVAQRASARGGRFRTFLAAAVVAFLMVGMAGWFYVQLGQQQAMVNRLQAELENTNSRVAELSTGREDVLAALRGMALLPSDPIEVCNLRPTGANPPQPGANGKLVLAKAKDRWWIVVRDLKPVSNDQIYVLWFLDDDRPIKRVNLGQGDREVEVNASGVPDVMTAAAITVEDSLESNRPTGPRVLYGHSREMDRL